MTALGSTGVSLVLPLIADEFDVGLGVAAWLITSYALAFAMGAAVYGRLVDVVGIRIPFAIAMGLYAIGALISVSAPDFAVLLGGRIVHSIGAACLPVLAPALLSGLFDHDERSLALGRFHGFATVLGALGPVLGGVIGDLLGWRAVMALPLLGLPAFAMLWRSLDVPGTGARLDVLGAVVVSTAAAGAVLLLQSPSTGWLAALIGVLMLCLGLPLAARHVRAHPGGFLPEQVLGNRRIVRSALGVAPVLAAWFALLITVPAVLAGHGWSPLQVGLALLPGVGVSLLMPGLAGRLLVRLGHHRSLVVAVAVGTGALVCGVLGDLAGLPSGLVGVLLVAAFCLVIFSMSLGQPALGATVAGAVDPGVRGVALGTSNLLFALGGSLGAATVGGLVEPLGTASAVGIVALASAAGLLSLLLLGRGTPRPDHPPSTAVVDGPPLTPLPQE